LNVGFSIEGSDKLCGAPTKGEGREGKATFLFSPEINCFIGGRGTGKSITLSALARVLGVDYDWPEDEEFNTPVARHFALFTKDSVFDPATTKITVILVKNDVPLKIEYYTEDGKEIWQLYGRNKSDSDWELIEERTEPFVEELPRPFFSLQNQLSSLADLKRQREELVHLITAHRAKERSKLRGQIRDLRLKYSELVQKKADLAQYEDELKTLNTSKEVLTKELTQLKTIAGRELSKEEVNLIGSQQALADAVTRLEELNSHLTYELQEFKNSADRLITTLDIIETELTKVTNSNYSNSPLVKIVSSLTTVKEEVTDYLSKTSKAIESFPSANRAEIDKAIELMKKKIDEAKKIAGKSEESKAAKAKLEEKTKNLSEIETGITKVGRNLTRIRNYLKQAGAEEQLHTEIIKKVKEETALLIESAKTITDDPKIKLSIHVTPAGDSGAFVRQRLTEAASKKACRIDNRYWEQLIEDADKHEEADELWTKLMNELQKGDPSQAKTWNEMEIFSDTAIGNLMTRISQATRDELSVTEIKDRIELLYQTKEGKEIPFRQASAGEQAVELLRLSLKESEGPVIMDQPESDLDNRYIVDHFINELHSVRTKHQIIFATHNANVVVQGDADQIYVMETKVVAVDGEEKEWCLAACEGTIDQPEVKKQIETILEGGREAFLNREAKYLGEIHS